MLLPLIIVMVVAGGFAAQNSMFDVYMAFLFGLVGLGMVRFGFPIAPVIIGVVLGGKAEFNLRVSLLMSAATRRSLFTADLHRLDPAFGGHRDLSAVAHLQGLETA